VNDAAWWVRVVQARTERDGLRPQRMWTLRNGEHAAAIDLKAVPGIDAEIVLTVDGELRKTRLFRSHEQAELVGAIADTRRDARTHAEWCKTAQTDTPPRISILRQQPSPADPGRS
jgi:hypothetical protein